MKLLVKKLNIESGRFFIALVHKEDANKMDLRAGDRIKIKKGSKETIAFIDVTTKEHKAQQGEIGLVDEIIKAMSLKQGDILEVVAAAKPLSVTAIRKKMENVPFRYEDTKQIIEDIINNKLSDIELTYFISGAYARGMSQEEVVFLIRSMVETGDKISLDQYPVVDKHCIGGVPGNRTSAIIVPIISAAGITIPKTSSRAITSPAGTADTLEVLMNVNLTKEKAIKVIGQSNGCMIWGGGDINLAPADDKIVQIERAIGVDAEGQMIASIMAKKLSVSATHILIDIPVGRHAKVQTTKKALHIKKQFEKIGEVFKVKIS